MPLPVNQPVSRTLREHLQACHLPLFGAWICSGSPVVAEIVAGSGLDWVLIDMEHAPNGLESTLAQLHAVSAYPVTPVVRVPAADDVFLKQVLDLGARTVVVPMVSTPEQAREVVRATQYPPAGRRGVGSALARSARWNRIEGYLLSAADHVSIIVQIETAEGVHNAQEIAATPGIDGVFVGPSDLAASKGLLGQQTHPEVVTAVDEALRAVQDAGKPVGVNAFDPDVARRYVAEGARFVLVGADVAMVARASEQLAADSSKFSALANVSPEADPQSPSPGGRPTS